MKRKTKMKSSTVVCLKALNRKYFDYYYYNQLLSILIILYNKKKHFRFVLSVYHIVIFISITLKLTESTTDNVKFSKFF